MKRFALAALTVLAASSSFASPSPDSSCRVRVNGQETGQVLAWNQFFSYVANQSRQYGCTYGKIMNYPNSGRVYENGIKLGENLSNSEARQVMRGGSCVEISCDEVGIVRGNESPLNEAPIIIVPSEGGY